jgi:hypothetical protein
MRCSDVSKIEQPSSEIRAPEPVDVAWISENYHDFKNMGQFSTDTNAMDLAVFAALKPGGTYMITDYVAAAGSGTRDTQSYFWLGLGAPRRTAAEIHAAGIWVSSRDGKTCLLRRQLSPKAAMAAPFPRSRRRPPRADIAPPLSVHQRGRHGPRWHGERATSFSPPMNPSACPQAHLVSVIVATFEEYSLGGNARFEHIVRRADVMAIVPTGCTECAIGLSRPIAPINSAPPADTTAGKGKL